ncbi:MAG: iron-sulfur cluster repair di-iron protein, partial [Bacteroidetes bacterium HGW-Bacteroidetes-15]
METLDVTQIEPKFKHSTIFQRFDALVGGESFVIHNDHDPKPLYYQMVAERGQTFDWEYIMEGPQFWEVKISKLNS